MKKLIGSVGILLFLLSSCMKDDSLKDWLSMDDPSKGMAVLAVFNMVESSDQLDVFLNDDMLNKVGETLKYRDFLRHRTVFPGKRTMTAQVRYGTKIQNAVPREITLEQGKNYSLFLYGNEANGMTLVEDNLILPQRGKFKVRFANFNVAQHASSIGDKIEATKYFNAIQPNKVTNFIELDIKENAFILSVSGQREEGFPIQFDPSNQGVYTVLVTAPRLESSTGRPQILYKVVQHP